MRTGAVQRGDTMNIDIGSLFGDAFAMFKERFWGMLGLWATFIGIIVALFIGYFIVVGASLAGFAAFAGGADASSAGFGGLGGGMIASVVVFYLAFLALIFAQQCAMCAKASPVERLSFGDAMARGFKAGLTMTALIIPLIIVQLVLSLLGMLVVGVASLASPILAYVALALLMPVAIYVACRFAVLMPVIAVEQVYNPIKAVNRSWAITQGRVLSIFVVLLISGAVGFVVFGLPAFAAGMLGGEGSLLVALMPLITFPLAVVFAIFFAAVNACLHAKISDYGAQSAAEVFQ